MKAKMLVRILSMLVFGLFMFAVGYFSRGLDFGWTDSKYNSVVAFWAMIGGWLSAIATLAAVIVSLHMAFKTSQNENEKIDIRYSNLKKSDFGDSWTMTVSIINARNIHTLVTGVHLSIDNGVLININHLALRQLLPFTFAFKGESASFIFNIEGGAAWWPIFRRLEQQIDLRFKKGKFVIVTATRSYTLPLNDNVVKAIKDRYEFYQNNLI